MPEDTGQREHLLRELFNGLCYLVRYGVVWLAMPNDRPPWHAVYDQAQRWLRAGCFEMLVHDLRAVLRLAQGRVEEPSVIVLDSRILRSTPESDARAAWDGHKRVKGSKPHLAIDMLGHLLAPHVTPASTNDRSAVAILAEAVQDTTGQSGDPAFVDQGYTGERSAQAAVAHGTALQVVKLVKPSAASCCCPGAGWSNASSPGSLASAVLPAATSHCLKPSRACIWLPFILLLKRVADLDASA